MSRSGRAVERRDDADAARQDRQRALARRVEQALGLQPALQLLEGGLQRAEAVRLERVADDLILALGFVDAEPAARDHAHAVFGRELQRPRRHAEHHARESARGRPSA